MRASGIKTVKPIDNPHHISILIPTRERPDYLRNLLNSLEEKTQDKKNMDVWLYVDDDDTPTQEFIDTNPSKIYNFNLNFIIGERTKSQGEMFNTLRRECISNPGIYIAMADDYVFPTSHWDDMVREAFNNYCDRIVLAYLPDPTAASEQITYMIVGAEWANILGRVTTEYFPFWFDDAWLDQVSQMVQRKVRIDVEMRPQSGRGKTIRMRNLLFWQKYFDNLMHERIEDAILLTKAIYPEGHSNYSESLNKITEVAECFVAEAQSRKEADLIQMEKELSYRDKMESQITPSDLVKETAYLAIEANAVNHLCKRFLQLLERGRDAEALMILDNIVRASQVPEIVYHWCVAHPLDLPAKANHATRELHSQKNLRMTELKKIQAEVKSLKEQIRGMESSKFWKLRTAWFRFKQTIGLPTDN